MSDQQDDTAAKPPRGFAMDCALARKLGAEGGRNQGAHNNSANFANDRAKAIEAGRKGGLARKGRKYPRETESA